MSFRSTILLLRFPFSLFLAPIALFGLTMVQDLSWPRAGMVLFLLHGLVYPASNGYNSYWDKDTGPIGGLAKPPMPTKGLLITVGTLDILALVLGYFVSPLFSLGILLYILASRAYSYPKFRLKAKPIISLLMIALGQGSLVFLLVYWFSGGTIPYLLTEVTWQPVFGAFLSACFLAGIYPLGQVYQHGEDAAHGDLTYSRLLGIQGTFLSSALFLGVAGLGFAWYFLTYASGWALAAFAVCMAPGVVLFGRWWFLVKKDESMANHRNSMTINVTASMGMNLFLALVLTGLVSP